MSKSSKGKTGLLNPTTPAAASRVQRVVAIRNGGAVPKGNVVGRMQKAAVNNFGKPGSK